MQKVKIVSFKSIEPFFSQERDGIKPFTTRLFEPVDGRISTIRQWIAQKSFTLVIRIINPATQESFMYEVYEVASISLAEGWYVIYFGSTYPPEVEEIVP